MNNELNSQHRRLKPVFILVAVALIGALFFTLPQGRILAQGILHFFNRGESNFMPGPTSPPLKWVEQTPGVAAATFTPQPSQTSQPASLGLAFEKDCGTGNAPHCSVEAIRERVSFPVFALTRIPVGMNFAGATGGPDRVLMAYTTSNQAGSLLIDRLSQLDSNRFARI